MGSGLPLTWAFVGLFTGFGKLVILAVLALLFYGRLGLPRHPLWRLLSPWSSVPADKRTKGATEAWYRDRVFVFLVVISATAVAAWIVTKMTLLGAPGASP
jgi:hypothetical protein